MEAVFERIPGVKSVVSGYAGGHVPNPTYEMVCTGLTGHAEVIQIEYDPAVVSYEKLLNIFWVAHDPTTLNRQEDDFGPNYRSIILYHNDEQKEAAEKSYKDLTRRRVFRSPIVTELVPLTEFYPAEAYHQDYYRNHRGSDIQRHSHRAQAQEAGAETQVTDHAQDFIDVSSFFTEKRTDINNPPDTNNPPQAERAK